MVRELVRRLGRTTVGKNLVHASVLRDPGELRFPNVREWPEGRVRGLEDLAFLFSSNQLNHGIASLQIDEAALLYRLARDLQGAAAELGRFKGGSTVIIASALPEGAELWSYDLHVALRPDLTGEMLDGEPRAALERLGVVHRVHLLVGDSRTVEPPPVPIGLLFVDGDHSYEGAKADFERWGCFVPAGGHLLFHDAVDTGGYGNVYPGVARAVAEVGGGWLRQPGAGTIAHFVKA